MATKRTNGENHHDVRTNGSQPITRAEFEALRLEVLSTCREVNEGVRRELQTQFTRITQLQQEIDGLKRNG